VLIIDCLSIVETDKVIHTVEIDIVKLVVEIKSFRMSSDEFNKETESSDRLQPKQADLSCVHALNKLHLHEIRVVPIDLTGDEDPTDEDGDNGIGDPIGVSVSLGCFRIMSSSTHPIILYDSDVGVAFSSTNIPNYALASPNYSPALPGNTFFDTSEDPSKDQLVPIAVSPFSDGPYMKFIQAYYATNELPIPPPQAPIAPPLSLVLSP
nr:hypothetical protein [Tanacetum cinerariifolium]